MQTLVAEVLAAWRRADRLVATLPQHSLEYSAAVVAAERLHDLYQDLVKVAGVVDEADARSLLTELAYAQGLTTGSTEPAVGDLLAEGT
jgi:hypothetical protein